MAVVLTAPETLQIVNREQAVPQAGEVLIRVKAAGIGGTDLRIYKGIVSAKLPLVLGQEFAGTVEKVGTAVAGFAVGDRVAVEPVVRDGTCEYCRRGLYTHCANMKVYGIHLDGGYSETISLPQYTLHKLPAGMTFEEGALVVPAAVAEYAVSRAGQIDKASVAVIGAGPIGLCALQIAVLGGATKTLVVEPLEPRAGLAKQFGATRTEMSQTAVAATVNEMTDNNGFDIVIEATGNPDAVDLALASARKTGTVVFAGAFGKPALVNMGNIVRKDLVVKGSWLYPNRYREALRLASESKIRLKDMITHRFKLADAQKAFETARDPGANKVIIAG